MPVKATLEHARVPIKLWTDLGQVEEQALKQLTNTASLPFVFKHVAAMPDVHLGKGATVGSVIATRGAVVPAAVGVDIGCGVMAVKTALESGKVMERLPKIRAAIERAVPVGHEGNRSLAEAANRWNRWGEWKRLHETVSGDTALLKRAQLQMGSLGGGNHFIEICLESTAGGEKSVWVLLHSGSRNIGKVLAERHIETAKDLMKALKVNLPDPDLAYLKEHTEAFKQYLHDLYWAQDYAANNRAEMMSRVLRELAAVVNGGAPLERLVEVNCHHNYVATENHFGHDVLVTRKGAVRAGVGEMGIIPGSMGAKSFIVRGKGNADSFCSCSHGAGRRMSRTQAKKTFTVNDLKRETEGVECRKDSGVLDEIPSSYKNIEEVMANQSDLVDVVAELKQVICIKG